MKHLTPTTKASTVPAPASLLETQQKVAVFSSLITTLGNLGNVLETYLGLLDRD